MAVWVRANVETAEGDQTSSTLRATKISLASSRENTKGFLMFTECTGRNFSSSEKNVSVLPFPYA